MMTQQKRSYNSEGRRAKAKQTRARILEEALGLFEREGYEPATIEMLAKISKVSEPTIYLLFKSKTGIMRELIEEAFSVSKFNELRELQKAETSPEERLKISAKIARRLHDTQQRQINLFRAAAVLSPELKAQEQQQEKRRYELQEDILAVMAKENCFKDGLSFAEVRDIHWALTSRDLYRLFVIERGWQADKYESWLAEQLKQALL